LSDTVAGGMKESDHIALFSGIATTFLDAPDEETIYDVIADAITTLCPGCYVMVSRIEEDKKLLSLQAIGGDRQILGQLMNDLGMTGLNAVVKMQQERIDALKQEGVITVPPSLASVTNHFIPPDLCAKYDRVLDIETIRVIPFVWKGRLYSAAPIICPRGVRLPEQTVLEAFARMVSVTLQRLEAESKLILAEKKYRTLADHASAIILQADHDLTISYANRHAVERFGWTEDELVGSSFAELMAYGRRDATACREMLGNAVRQGERDLEGEHYFSCADGGRICLAWRATLAYEDDGSLARLSWTALDVTEQRHVAERIAESEHHYRTIFESAGDGIVIMDERVVIDCNERAVHLFGASSKEEIIGHRPGAYAPECQEAGIPSSELMGRYIADAMAGEDQFFDWRLGRIGGGYAEVEITMTPLTMNGRRQILAVIHDVSAARRSERALRASREQLRMVTDGSFDAIISSDPRGTITYASPSSGRILGVPADAILGTNCLDLFPPDRRARAELIFGEIVHGSVFEGIQFPYLRPDGSEIFVELSAGPIERDGTPAGAMAVVRDISAMERAKQAELEVKYTTSLLSASLENTPLGVALFHLTPGGIRVADWNHSMGKILGWKPEDIVGKMLAEVIPERIAGAIHGALLEIARYGRPGFIRSRCGTLTGGRVHLNWFHNPFIDPRSGEQYVMSLAEDMTEVEEARQALEDSEEQYRRTIDAIAEPVFVVDRELKVRVSNRSFTRWLENLGYPGESTGRRISDVAPFFTGERCGEIEQVFADAGPLATIEDIRIGDIRCIMDISRVPVIKNGLVVEVAVLMRDITAEQELEVLKKEAFEQIEWNMEQFAILNDHIRNPLQGILGICELDGIEHYDLIQGQVEEIDAIVRRLDMGYLESEKVRKFLRKHYGMLDA
jgi:PAS domain S-box-containing protein